MMSTAARCTGRSTARCRARRRTAATAVAPLGQHHAGRALLLYGISRKPWSGGNEVSSLAPPSARGRRPRRSSSRTSRFCSLFSTYAAVRHHARRQRDARRLLRRDRRLGDPQLAVLGDRRRDPQVALEADARDVVVDRAGPDLAAVEEAGRVLVVLLERQLPEVLVVDAEDRVDRRLEADRDVDAVALAGDVPEQVRLAAGLADDDVLRPWPVGFAGRPAARSRAARRCRSTTSTCVPGAAMPSDSAFVRSTVLLTFGGCVKSPGAIAGYGNGVWSGPRISLSPDLVAALQVVDPLRAPVDRQERGRQARTPATPASAAGIDAESAAAGRCRSAASSRVGP